MTLAFLLALALAADPPSDPRVRKITSPTCRHIQGEVELMLAYDRQGKVVDVQVAQTSGSEWLDAAAARAGRTWTVRPATRDGSPVAGTTRVPIRFDAAALTECTPPVQPIALPLRVAPREAAVLRFRYQAAGNDAEPLEVRWHRLDGRKPGLLRQERLPTPAAGEERSVELHPGEPLARGRYAVELRQGGTLLLYQGFVVASR